MFFCSVTQNTNTQNCHFVGFENKSGKSIDKVERRCDSQYIFE